jgi:hypothetical protein
MRFPADKLEACYWESDPILKFVSATDTSFDGTYLRGEFVFKDTESGQHYQCKFKKSHLFQDGLNYRFTEDCIPVKPVETTVVKWVPIASTE